MREQVSDPIASKYQQVGEVVKIAWVVYGPPVRCGCLLLLAGNEAGDAAGRRQPLHCAAGLLLLLLLLRMAWLVLLRRYLRTLLRLCESRWLPHCGVLELGFMHLRIPAGLLVPLLV